MSQMIQSEIAAFDTAAIYQIGGHALPADQARAFLRITGPDATRWLNGMVTNSIQSLAPLQGNYNFLLNAQGRIQGDCTIYRAGPNTTSEPVFILETTLAQIDTLEALLTRFIIMDDVTLTRTLDIDGLIPEQRGLGLAGTDAPKLLLHILHLLNQRIQTLPTAGHLCTDNTTGTPFAIFAPPATLIPTYEVWCQDGLQLELIRQNLLSMGATQVSPAAVEAHRILSGQPKYGQDIRNTEAAKDLPQETAQTHALHFNKGCYVGQEIVERIHSRGQVHRTFATFTLAGTVPTLPAPLLATAGDQLKPAGELTSAVHIGNTIHALGYIRREHAAATLTYPGGIAMLKSQI